MRLYLLIFKFKTASVSVRRISWESRAGRQKQLIRTSRQEYLRQSRPALGCGTMHGEEYVPSLGMFLKFLIQSFSQTSSLTNIGITLCSPIKFSYTWDVKTFYKCCPYLRS
jgi:hypothetical protein